MHVASVRFVAMMVNVTVRVKVLAVFEIRILKWKV